MAMRDIVIVLALLPQIVADGTCEGNNLALGKIVFQSNELQSGVYATDDNAETDSNLCSRANSTTNESPWLVVDLGEPYLISFVTFLNPQLGVPLDETVHYTFEVTMSIEDPYNQSVFSATCGSSVLNVDGWVWVRISCEPVVWGRYVRLQKTGNTEILSVCEIQVYPARRATMISNRLTWSSDNPSGFKHTGSIMLDIHASRVVCVIICHAFPGCVGFNFKDGVCEFFRGPTYIVSEPLWEVYRWE